MEKENLFKSSDKTIITATPFDSKITLLFNTFFGVYYVSCLVFPNWSAFFFILDNFGTENTGVLSRFEANP